ncbi:MAG: metallophosphoesterase [Gemmatimonadota bacterium]
MKLHAHGARARLYGVLAVAALSSADSAAAQEQWRWEGVERQVVIPDVHGAFDEFVQLLKATEVVDENLHWIGGETHLVSLGDLLDRGPASRQAMDLLMRLEGQAVEAGGRVHVILGNHEELVLTGDLRYVSEGEYDAFAPDETEEMREAGYAWFRADALGGSPDSEGARAAFDSAFPHGYFGLRAGFASDGTYGSWLLDLPTIIVINNTAYVHAGLPELISEMSLAEVNERVSADLNAYVATWEMLVDEGHLAPYGFQDPAGMADEALELAEDSGTSMNAERMNALEHFIEIDESAFLGGDGPMWYRGSVYCKPILEGPVLHAALDRLGAERVVVGHTPTLDRRAHSLFDGRLIMMDTGMLVSYYDGRPAALIIEDGETTVFDLQSGEWAAPSTGGQPIAGPFNRAAALNALNEGEVTVLEESRRGPWQVRISHEGHEVDALFYRDDAGELEQAAYVLDELLGFDMVPPTVSRRVDGKKGALQLWYGDAVTESQRIANQMGIGGFCAIDPQFDLMSIFDFLTYNRGRSEDNVLWRRSLWNLYITGHGDAFDDERRLGDRVSEVLLTTRTESALSALDQDTLEEAMDGLLNRGQIRALLARRDVILREARRR